MVDRRARELLAERLRGTRWDNPDDIAALESRFCTSIKETFTSVEERQYLTVGSTGETIPDKGIKRGKLVLEGEEVSRLFEPSIQDSFEAIGKRLFTATNDTPTYVAMVGGFSESVYFRQELQKRLGESVRLYKPDEAT